jgi:hypothetical protein
MADQRDDARKSRAPRKTRTTAPAPTKRGAKAKRAKSARAEQEPQKRGRGRPSKVPTETEIKLVEQMAVTGLTKRAMAAKLGIDIKTFDKLGERYFFPAIERGQADGALLSGMTLVQMIRSKNLGALIWYEKTRLGMTEKVHTVHSDPEGNALPAATHVGIGIFLPPNGRDVPAAGAEIPANFRVVPSPPIALPPNGREQSA